MNKKIIKILIVIVVILALTLSVVYAYNKILKKQDVTLPSSFEYELTDENSNSPKLSQKSSTQPSVNAEENEDDSESGNNEEQNEETSGSGDVTGETVPIENVLPEGDTSSAEDGSSQSETVSSVDDSETVESASSAAQFSDGAPYVGTVNNGVLTYEDGLYYITDNSTGTKFIIVNKSYTVPESYGSGDLTSECAAAFSKLVAAAKNDGIDIFSVSGFRSYSYQERIYNNYVARDGQAAADKYSARPGHSEHQTGLAIDCNSLSSSWGETPEGKWLAAHCTEYGFIIRYRADKISSTGYQYEPWHIRYIGSPELAKKLTDSGMSVEEYYGIKSEY